MNISNITDTIDDYNNITDYDNITSTNITISNYTDSENDIDIIIPTPIFTIPCGLSFLCLMSLIVYTLFKPLFNKKRNTNTYSSTYLSNINGEVSLSNSSR